MANRAAAVAEAKRILATYQPPPGATLLAHPPKGVLTSPALGYGSSRKYQIDDTVWYTLPHGSAKKLVASVIQPTGTQFGGSATGGDSGTSGEEYGVAYDWPLVEGVLTERSLTVSAASGGGTTIIRVDAIAGWQPARDPRSLVPATATTVTVSYKPSQFGSPAPTQAPPVTTTDPTEVAAIAAVVNAAQILPDGVVRMCPYDGGQLMTVVFRAGAGGPIVATARISPSGCSTVALTVSGGVDATLTGGHAIAVAIGKIVHRPWPAS